MIITKLLIIFKYEKVLDDANQTLKKKGKF